MNVFKPGEELYYVNPFMFHIDKVLIEFIEYDEEVQQTFYIDHCGAYLAEFHLFRDLGSAQQVAFSMLNDFYQLKLHEIMIAKPELDIQEGD